MTGEAVRLGRLALLEWISLLSLNLAIINILPIPALDGGRLLFILIEKVSGRRIHLKWEQYAHQIGFFLLIALALLVTVNDVIRYLGK